MAGMDICVIYLYALKTSDRKDSIDIVTLKTKAINVII